MIIHSSFPSPSPI